MKKVEINTIEELHAYMADVQKRIAGIRKRHPDLSVYGSTVKDIPLDLIFEAEALKNKGKSYLSSYEKITHHSDYLSLSYYHDGVSITLNSVKVKQAAKPEMSRSDFEELV